MKRIASPFLAAWVVSFLLGSLSASTPSVLVDEPAPSAESDEQDSATPADSREPAGADELLQAFRADW